MHPDVYSTKQQKEIPNPPSYADAQVRMPNARITFVHGAAQSLQRGKKENAKETGGAWWWCHHATAVWQPLNA